MFGSPAKRRRTSPAAFVSVRATNEDHTTQSNPSTPRRASYLSPTKASLARSHPNILSHTRKTRLSSPRKDTLRDKVLGNSKQTKDNPTTAPSKKPLAEAEATSGAVINTNAESPNAPSFDFADIVTNAFASAPRTARSPLRERQPTNNQEQADGNEKTSAAQIVPRLVSKDDRNPRAVSERRSTEPDLPPTPVQLGLDQPPERPRGLASSSSPGGSGRRRIRNRGGQVTSSPLKPKEMPPSYPTIVPVDIEIASGIDGDVENEHAARPQSILDHEQLIQVTTHLRDKQNSLQSLKKELEKMNMELEKLNSLNSSIQKSNGKNSGHVDQLLAMLDEGNVSTNPSLSDLDSHPTFMQNPSVFLSLFAPGSLQLSYTTWTKQIKKRAKMVHQVTVCSPKPWPAEIMNLTFDVVIDIAEASIENIEQLNVLGESQLLVRTGHLHDWLGRRLSDPLHNKDLVTLVWGAGRYFEECVKRAKVFQFFSQKYGKDMTEPDLAEGEKTAVKYLRQMHAREASATKDEVQTLLPFLAQTQKTFYGQIEDGVRVQKKLMLIYEIQLSWTGSATTTIQILPSGVPYKAQRAAEEVFDKAMKTRNVYGAFEAVWDLLGLGSEIEDVSNAGPRSKRKRGNAN